MTQEPRDPTCDPPTSGRALPREGPAPSVVAIDDDPTALLMIARTLEADGMLCRTATTGAEGLRLIRQRQPDLVLLDIVMVDEDGFTICREIRRAWSPEQLPVVMVTGLEDLASIQTAYQVGANDFLTKPLHWKHLAYRIHHILRANRAFKALRESEQRLELAVRSGNLGIWDRNLQDETVVWNDRMFEIYGLGRTYQPSHQDWATRLVHPEDQARVQEAMRSAVATGTLYQTDFRVVLPGGRIRHISSNGMVLRDGSGQPIRTIGVNRDCTEQVLAEFEHRRLQEERQRSEKLESLGSLAGGVAHDMNNVLAAIMGMASALRSSCGDQDLRARPLDSILHASSRGRDLVKGLTDFACMGLDEHRWFDLNELLRKEVALLGHARLRQVRLVLDLDPGLPRILGDAAALGGALMNLGINALDAMPEGGTLTFRSRALPGGQIELAVTDTGCGMAPDILARAMEPFFTTKPAGEGNGLGLARVYGTVKAHGGTLELQSRPGQGTCVRLLLPSNARALRVLRN
ncbi:MAG: response regulator [Holophaga sp.]|nr:response regulator [Holophaga sp.]